MIVVVVVIVIVLVIVIVIVIVRVIVAYQQNPANRTPKPIDAASAQSPHGTVLRHQIDQIGPQGKPRSSRTALRLRV